MATAASRIRWRSLLALTLACTATAGPRASQNTTAAEAPPVDAALLGCWRAERVEQTAADGSVWTDIGGCTLEFDAQRITSACALRAGNQPVRYRWHVVAPGVYRAQITEHPAQPQAIGSEREYQYRVEGDRLYITTFPQTAVPPVPSRAVKVESVSVKVDSPTDRADRSERDKAGCQGRLVQATPMQRLAVTTR